MLHKDLIKYKFQDIEHEKNTLTKKLSKKSFYNKKIHSLKKNNSRLLFKKRKVL